MNGRPYVKGLHLDKMLSSYIIDDENYEWEWLALLEHREEWGERQHCLQEWTMCLVNTVNEFWISR